MFSASSRRRFCESCREGENTSMSRHVSTCSLHSPSFPKILELAENSSCNSWRPDEPPPPTLLDSFPGDCFRAFCPELLPTLFSQHPHASLTSPLHGGANATMIPQGAMSYKNGAVLWGGGGNQREGGIAKASWQAVGQQLGRCSGLALTMPEVSRQPRRQRPRRRAVSVLLARATRSAPQEGSGLLQTFACPGVAVRPSTTSPWTRARRPPSPQTGHSRRPTTSGSRRTSRCPCGPTRSSSRRYGGPAHTRRRSRTSAQWPTTSTPTEPGGVTSSRSCSDGRTSGRQRPQRKKESGARGRRPARRRCRCRGGNAGRNLRPRTIAEGPFGEGLAKRDTGPAHLLVQSATRCEPYPHHKLKIEPNF